MDIRSNIDALVAGRMVKTLVTPSQPLEAKDLLVATAP